MHSKWLKLSVAMLGMVVFTSCGYFFDKKDQPKKSYNLTVDEKGSVSCVKQNSDLLRDYFDLKRDDVQIAQQLREMKGCIRDTIDLFVKHTQSSSTDPNTYAARDLHEFLSSVFDSYDFKEQFMDDVFILKDSLIGGGATRVSKDEIRILPDYVDVIYEGLANLAVERHLLFSKDFENPDKKFVHPDDWAKFAPAGDKFLQVVRTLHSLKFKGSGNFDYQSLVRIAMAFVHDPADIDHWTKTFRLVNSLQSLIASGQHDNLDIQKFNFTVDNLAGLYLAYIEYYRYLLDDYFYQDMATVFTFPALVSRAVDNPQAFSGNKPQILNSVHHRILSALSNAADQAPRGQLSLDYLDDIVATLFINESLPSYINPDTLKGMFPQFFNVWLSPQGCSGDACLARTANSTQIRELQRQLDQWAERQMWINTSLSERTALSRNMPAFTKHSSNPNIASLQAAVQKINHVHWNNQYLMIGMKDLTFKDLVIFHDIYTLAELFARPFNNNGSKPQMLDYFLDRDQALTFYRWFRPLGLEIKIVDPRASADSTAAFTEINMFGSTAVDPDKMDLAELIEYFEISISTSFRAVNLITTQFQDCKIPDRLDVFGYPMIKADCFRQEWSLNYNDYLFSSMPRLQNYLKDASDLTVKNMLNSLEKAARQGLMVNEPAETDTFRQMSSITMYTESLFDRFDADGNNIITPAEMKAALAHIVPNITGILTSSVDPKTVALLRKIFPKFEENLITYVLVKHDLPDLLTAETEAGQLIGVAQIKAFKLWADSQDQWLNNDAAVTREDVMLVIAGLSSLARVTKIKNMKKHFYDHELDFDKPLSGPQDPLLKPLADNLNCSYKVDAYVHQWLYDHKKDYWDGALDWITPGSLVLFGWDASSLGLTWSNLPEINDIQIPNVPFIGDVSLQGFTKGWEGKVTYKLIELVSKDPTLGPLCGVPYVPGVHQIAAQQYYQQRMCDQTVLLPLLPIPTQRCSIHYRTPY